MTKYTSLSNYVEKMQGEIDEISQKGEENEVNRIIEEYEIKDMKKQNENENEENQQEKFLLAPENKVISAEKIIDFLEQTMSDANVFEDDDKDVNEISSLTNQFSFISKSLSNNFKSGISRFGDYLNTKTGANKSDLEIFVHHVIDGKPVNDQNLENVFFYIKK